MRNINKKDVVNTRFGQGVVQSVDSSSNAYSIEIDGNVVIMNNTYINSIASKYNSSNYEIVSKL